MSDPQAGTSEGKADPRPASDTPAGEDLHAVAAAVVATLAERGLTVASCESLTGGLVGATITNVPGSSAVYRGGLITYASDLKVSLAGLDEQWVRERGVINETAAVGLALAAQHRCGAMIGLSCTGVAGPETQDGQPVGTVWLGLALDRPGADDPVLTRRLDLTGDRASIREQTVGHLLRWLLQTLSPIDDQP